MEGHSKVNIYRKGEIKNVILEEPDKESSLNKCVIPVNECNNTKTNKMLLGIKFHMFFKKSFCIYTGYESHLFHEI